MPFTNRYSSYHGQSDYKSTNYSIRTPWRPPRYVPPTKSVAIPINQKSPQIDQEIIDAFSTDVTISLPNAVTDVLQAEVDYNMQEVHIGVCVCE